MVDLRVKARGYCISAMPDQGSKKDSVRLNSGTRWERVGPARKRADGKLVEGGKCSAKILVY